ncbi:MAG: hypothetical protein AAF293_00490 [Pseudomonadota bacterium]
MEFLWLKPYSPQIRDHMVSAGRRVCFRRKLRMNGIGAISINGANVFGSSQEMRDRLTAKVDTDQNGRVSFEEIAATERGAPVADRLRAFDADGSGDLSTEELSQVQQHIAEKVREKVQAAAFSGADQQALFGALFADKDDRDSV